MGVLSLSDSSPLTEDTVPAKSLGQEIPAGETMVNPSAASGGNDFPGLHDLEIIIGYSFHQMELLKQALSHRSYIDEQPGKGGRHNETLEFLGDAILGLFVSRELFHRYPNAKVGSLAKAKSYLVSSAHLHSLSCSISIGNFLLLSSAEDKALGRKKKGLLADTYEALIAALYLDGGMGAVESFLCRQFEPAFQNLDMNRAGHADFKSTLLEEICLQRWPEPKFRVLAETGPQHEKTFRIELEIPSLVSFHAVGRSKKEGQQAACRIAWEMMEELKKCRR